MLRETFTSAAQKNMPRLRGACSCSAMRDGLEHRVAIGELLRDAGADLAICHLEGPIAPPGKAYAGQPLFASPPDIVQSIKDVGYEVPTRVQAKAIPPQIGRASCRKRV